VGREPFVAVVVVIWIVVVAVRSWIVRAIVIVIASPISSVVSVVRLLIYPHYLAFFIK
jgi:hypothetical protein